MIKTNNASETKLSVGLFDYIYIINYIHITKFANIVSTKIFNGIG